MKPKTSLIAGILMACLAVVLGISTVAKNDDDTQNSDTRNAAYNPAVDSSPRNRGASPRRLVRFPQPARESAQAFEVRLNAVMLIQDPALRLEAIRKQLGMDISDALYQKALVGYGYQNNSKRLLEIIGKLWVYEDPAAATAWAHRLQAAGATGHRTYISNVPVMVGSLPDTIYALAQWIHVDPARAMAWAKAQGIDPEDIERAGANSAAVNDKLRPKPAGEIIDELKRLETRALAGNFSSETRNEFTRLTITDPAAAIDFFKISMVNYPSDRPNYIRLFHDQCMEIWAQLDPDGALLAAKDMQDGSPREMALSDILATWQLKYPDRSITEVIDMDSIVYGGNVKVRILEDLAVRNPSAAFKFAMEIEDPYDSLSMIKRVIGSSVRVSPTEAIRAVAEIPNGEFRDDATSYLAEEISKIDFQQVSPLLDQITSDEQRLQTIDLILGKTRISSRSWQDSISLIDRVPSVPAWRAIQWAEDIPQEDVPAFRAWLVQSYDTGKLGYGASYLRKLNQGVQPDETAGQSERESNYQEALSSLDERIREKP